jgi:transketolase C-terminal domain/subunit
MDFVGVQNLFGRSARSNEEILKVYGLTVDDTAQKACGLLG